MLGLHEPLPIILYDIDLKSESTSITVQGETPKTGDTRFTFIEQVRAANGIQLMADTPKAQEVFFEILNQLKVKGI